MSRNCGRGGSASIGVGGGEGLDQGKTEKKDPDGLGSATLVSPGPILSTMWNLRAY